MQLPNVPEQIKSVDDWYSKTLVYRYGSYEQQRSKFYRCLGEIAEGVQKDDGLKVAAGIGRAIWTYAGMCAMAKGPSIHNLSSALEYAIGFKQPSVNKHEQLHILMSLAMDAVYQTPKEHGYDLHEWITAVNTLMAGFGKMARACGLEFDRVVYNGHYALIRTQGEMNELGMFIPKASDWPGETRYASGATTRFYIQSMISQCLSQCFAPYMHEIFDERRLPEISKRVNDVVDDAMERYVRHDPKWRGLLFERTPGVIVGYSDGNASAQMNDDLMFIINELKKDTGSNETISGLTPRRS